MKKINQFLFIVLGLIAYTTLNAQNKPDATVTRPTATSELPVVDHQPLHLVNYVRSYSFYTPLSLSDASSDSTVTAHIGLNNVNQITNYFDGLGRSVQSVSRKASGNGQDIIRFTSYDVYGRRVFSPLPYEASTVSGEMQLTPQADQQTKLANYYPGEDVFYAESEYESSPLNRLTKQMSPGNSWVGSDNGVTMEYLTNTEGEGVRIWDVSSSIPTTTSYYPAGELIKTVTTDEDGRVMKEYTDKRGLVILRQVKNVTSPTDSHDDWLNTYYLYDDWANLVYVFPPKAVESLTAGANNWDVNLADIQEAIYEYDYDERNRLVSKKVPGAEPLYMVYDQLDRLVLTQDGNQRPNNEWSFNKYDILNRITLVGIVTDNRNHSTMQNDAMSWSGLLYVKKDESSSNIIQGTAISVSERDTNIDYYQTSNSGSIEFLPGFESTTNDSFTAEIIDPFTGSFSYLEGYYDNTFPQITGSSKLKLNTITYYDDYNFTSHSWSSDFSGFYNAGFEDAETSEPHYNVKGKTTGSKVRILGTNQYLETVTFFDVKGRPVQVLTENKNGGHEIITTQYDFSGRVLNAYTKHTNPKSTTDPITRILDRYEYNDQGRLVEVTQKLNETGGFVRIAENLYDEMGQMVTKKIGSDPSNNINPLETLDYEYNIRGWLKGINGDYAETGTGGHYFGMELSYDYGFEKTNLNGNISGVQWRTASGTRQRAYGFEYDLSNRLTKADYNHKDTGETNWSKIVGTNNNDFSTSYAYDVNGNITSLERMGVIAGESFKIDDLNYTYTGNTNELLKVEEDVISPQLAEGFNNTNGSSNDYTYDDNGNLQVDNNKNITNISYNYLNLPSTITFSGGRTIDFVYDAVGAKLGKIVNDNGSLSSTDYITGFVYHNDELQFFGHEEGRVRKNNLGNLVYDFYIKDHLGNTRMTITEVADVVEYRATMETDVTPAGVNLEEYEEQLFLNLNDTRAEPGDFNVTNITGITNDESVRLNGSDANRRIGPAKMLAVNAGDQVSLTVDYAHGGGGTSTNPLLQDDMVGALASTFAQLNGGASAVEGALDDMFRSPGATAKAYAGNGGVSSQPRAYMTYILFNQDFEYIDGNFYQVQSTTTGVLTANVTVPEGGFMYVYLSNENPNNFDVFFDDFFITHTKSDILQEDHYYPFGMNISALSSTTPNARSNNYKLGGFEEQTDFDLNWYDYQARFYDAQLGRFMQVDPMADKMRKHSVYNYAFDNPIRFIDPDGMSPDDTQNDDPLISTLDWSWTSDGGAAANEMASYGHVEKTETESTDSDDDQQDQDKKKINVDGWKVTNSMWALDNEGDIVSIYSEFKALIDNLLEDNREKHNFTDADAEKLMDFINSHLRLGDKPILQTSIVTEDPYIGKDNYVKLELASRRLKGVATQVGAQVLVKNLADGTTRTLNISNARMRELNLNLGYMDNGVSAGEGTTLNEQQATALNVGVGTTLSLNGFVYRADAVFDYDVQFYRRDNARGEIVKHQITAEVHFVLTKEIDK